MFVGRADAVGLARAGLPVDLQERSGVVHDVEPVADVVALAVDGDRLAVDRAEDDRGDQLLGMLVRAVVVRAVGDEHRQAVRRVPCPDQVVAGGLARGVGAVGGVTGGLGERRVARAEAAEHFIRRDVHEAKLFGRGWGEPGVVRPGGFEEDLGADDVGLDKLGGVSDRAVDVRLGSEVEDAQGLVFGEGRAEGRGVADIGFDQFETVGREVLEVFAAAGVGEFVVADDAVVGLGQQQVDEVRADEAGGAGDQEYGRGQGGRVLRWTPSTSVHRVGVAGRGRWVVQNGRGEGCSGSAGCAGKLLRRRRLGGVAGGRTMEFSVVERGGRIKRSLGVGWWFEVGGGIAILVLVLVLVLLLVIDGCALRGAGGALAAGEGLGACARGGGGAALFD